MDIDSAWRVVDRLYEAAATGAGWEFILNDIADVVNADNAWLVFAAPALGMNTVVAPRSDPDIISSYQQHWWKKDVTLDVALRTPVGKITSLRNTGQVRFAASEFYNDFWRRSGQASERLAANLIVERGALASFGLQPSPLNDCIESDLAKDFALILPHLVRSVQIRCAIRKVELERQLARSKTSSGALLVDAEARVIIADSTAREIIARSRGIWIDHGCIGLSAAPGTARLRELISRCRDTTSGKVRGGRIQHVCKEDGSRVRIEVIPCRDGGLSVGPEYTKYPTPLAMLLLADPEQWHRKSRAILRREFGLTPAEATIALELMQGDTRASVASRLGVSLSTVRTHMMHIFAKAGVTSRAGLIRQMTQVGVKDDLAAVWSGSDAGAEEGFRPASQNG